MAEQAPSDQPFNIVIVGQQGRLMYEAALFAASLRATSPDFKGRLFVAEPQPGIRWGDYDPRIRNDQVLELLADLGAEILPFESVHFGGYYPYGNKIECLTALPKGEPFVFFDTDTLITGDLTQVPFDFSRPTASMRREGTWPKLEIYGPGYGAIWKSLYDRFGLDFDSSLDLDQPDEYWQRYLYFNAGFFFYNARMCLVKSFWNMRCRSAMTRRPKPCCRNWTPGWIRWRCRWSFMHWAADVIPCPMACWTGS